MRLISACALALLLAGCAESTLSQSGVLSGGGASSARPKVIVVTDFTISPDVQVLDRGFTTRLERKIGAFPTYERKQRTVERVNDEIVATVVATLREAGLDAQPGSEEGLSLSESTVLASGKLRPSDAAAKKNDAGIGGGKGGVVADMTLSSFGGFGKRQLISFTADAGGKLATGRQAAPFNALMAEALAANKAAPEKLSPDVEAAARRIGRGVGERIVAFGKTQGWFSGGAEEGAAEAAPAAEVKPAKPAAARTAAAAKPEAKPAAPKPAARAAKPKPAAKPAEDAADSDDTPAAD